MGSTINNIRDIQEKDRLFSCVMPEGISYADRTVEKNGDYKKLAFLGFARLDLKIEPGCNLELKKRIEEDAAIIQAKQGEEYQVSTSG